MNTNNAATRQDLIENSVDRQISTLTNSAASPEQLETLLNSELDHDLIEWPRQYLETYLDSDATGRVPLNPEQLQDVLEAAAKAVETAFLMLVVLLFRFQNPVRQNGDKRAG